MSCPTIPALKVLTRFVATADGSIYKGPFATQAEIEALEADEGDYADCYETGTRWQYISGAWTNTEVELPSNEQYVEKSEVSDNATPNSVVRYTESGNIIIEAPTQAKDAANKQYVDDATDELDNRLTDVEDSIANPQLKVQTI